MRRVKITAIVVAACLLVALAAAGAFAGEVFQGVCKVYDEQKKVMTLANTEPDKNKVDKSQQEVTFDLSRAKVGLTPAAGDKMRVAYVQEGDKLMALKVMNVTKQDLRKK